VSEANKALVRNLFEKCLNQHKAAIHSEYYSDVLYHAPAMGIIRGEAHQQFLISIFRGFPDARWTIEDQIAEKDKIVTRWTFVGTHAGTFMGIAPTGRHVILSGFCIDRITRGKIVEEWEEWDTLGMMRQLGAIESERTIGDLVAP